MNFEMIRTEKYIVKIFSVRNRSRNLLLKRLYNYVDMMQSMNGIVCWYDLLV